MTRSSRQSLPVSRSAAALNETTNIAETRLTALRNHVAVAIVVMPTVTAVIALQFVGYASGVNGSRRQVSIVILSALLAFVIVITQDLERPDRGVIAVPRAALRDALAGIPQPPRR